MTTHYTIHSPSTGRTLKVSYKSGKFFRLELVKGKKLEKDEVMIIGMAIPANEECIEEYSRTYDKLTYTKIEKTQSYYQKYVSAWYDFYNAFMKIAPRFNGADGKHINQIKAHLTRVSTEDMEGLELFKLILDNWHKLDDFHKENTDLKYINSRLNVILNATRKAGQTGTGGADNSVGL